MLLIRAALCCSDLTIKPTMLLIQFLLGKCNSTLIYLGFYPRGFSDNLSFRPDFFYWILYPAYVPTPVLSFITTKTQTNKSRGREGVELIGKIGKVSHEFILEGKGEYLILILYILQLLSNCSSITSSLKHPTHWSKNVFI